jgi:hypothetical protein
VVKKTKNHISTVLCPRTEGTQQQDDVLLQIQREDQQPALIYPPLQFASTFSATLYKSHHRDAHDANIGGLL